MNNNLIWQLRHTRFELRPRSQWRKYHALRKRETTRKQKRTLPSSSYRRREVALGRTRISARTGRPAAEFRVWKKCKFQFHSLLHSQRYQNCLLDSDQTSVLKVLQGVKHWNELAFQISLMFFGASWPGMANSTVHSHKMSFLSWPQNKRYDGCYNQVCKATKVLRNLRLEQSLSVPVPHKGTR
jgi:hypothetical protein